MFRPQVSVPNDTSPSRKQALKGKKSGIKIAIQKPKNAVHKHNLSEISAPKYNPNVFIKQTAPTSVKKTKEVPKLLFTKLKEDIDLQLTTTRARKHKYNLSDNVSHDISYNKPPKPLDPKKPKLTVSPIRISDGISSTDSLIRSYTSRRTAEDEKRLIWASTKLPATPATVLKIFMHKMSNFEQAEILNYHEIYFIKPNAPKDQLNKNYGYDDDKGDYKIAIGDHIAYRYEILALLGRGSFGQVVKVLDHKTKKEVALKVIRNKSRFHEQALVEIDILKYLKEKDPNDCYCIVHLEDYFAFRKHMVTPT